MLRPTHKELTNKIAEACDALKKEQVSLINQAALAADALEFGYLIGSELLEVLDELLNKTKPAGYTGTKPPKRSYEQEIQGLDLFAFVVKIERFPEPVYYKFAIAHSVLWLVSLHKNRT